MCSGIVSNTAPTYLLLNLFCLADTHCIFVDNILYEGTVTKESILTIGWLVS